MVELLSAKIFIPLLRSNLVPRPRLIQQISDGLHSKHKLTLISAPAGFGETTPGAAWLNYVHLLSAKREHKCNPQLNSNKAS